jgi:cellobiose-specific phosphotransferase system component IIA
MKRLASARRTGDRAAGMTSDAPLEAASALVQKVHVLLVEAHVIRERLIAMDARGSDEAERHVMLPLVSALEDGMRRTLEEAVATMKGMKAEAAEAWVRRQVERLTDA